MTGTGPMHRPSITLHKAAFLCVLLLAGSAAGQSPDAVNAGVPGEPDYSVRYDVLISGGTIVDGTGAPSYRAEVLIEGDGIAYVGQLDRSRIRADQVLDATGRVVTPGFIDTHAHGDPLVSGLQESFVLQGVTTKVVGQDGRTPGFHMDIRAGYRLSLDEWRKSMASPDPASEHPRSLLEWSLKVEQAGVAPNIAALVGIGSLRWMTGVGTRPVPTPEQLAMMIEILEAEMQAGAFGISSGLEYVPERYSHTDELVAMAKVVGARDGVVMSHMRTEDAGAILGAIDELVAQGRHARVNASHIKIVGGLTWQEGVEVVDRIRDARAEGVDITADVYPYVAGMADMALVYPSWAKQRSEFEAAAENDRPRLEQALFDRVMSRHGPERILIVSGEFSGKTLAEAAESLALPFVDVLIDVFGFGGPGAAHFTQSRETHDVFIVADHIAIGTDGSPSTRHPRSYGTYPKVIEEYVVNDARMSLEKAVHKMTGLPARITGLRDRGTVEAGKKADLVIFAPENVRARATWTHYDLPPEGFDFVLVNGRVAVRHGVLSEQPHGKVLRKGVN
ncbi:MAG: amidohydrolase family protein [Gammaproteobacteria bacterium]|nr:amidohydrolase family protein [Gammaproteobacteria bacterium]MYL00183.1 amidohydrolase family protein [Gammaproteobacteria bacterium]